MPDKIYAKLPPVFYEQYTPEARAIEGWVRAQEDYMASVLNLILTDCGYKASAQSSANNDFIQLIRKLTTSTEIPAPVELSTSFVQKVPLMDTPNSSPTSTRSSETSVDSSAGKGVKRFFPT
jgi:hypothetical protein